MRQEVGSAKVCPDFARRSLWVLVWLFVVHGALVGASAQIGTASCRFDSDCDDGVWCNGQEVCETRAGVCQKPAEPPCGIGFECNEKQQICRLNAKIESLYTTAEVKPTRVDFVQVYADPVVVCSVERKNIADPVVVRISNVTADGFHVRLQPQDSPEQSSWQRKPREEKVSCVAAEAGAWVIDGVKFEAQKYLSTVTDGLGNWVGEPQSYLQSYTQPVVVGQVMSENDSRFSTFWARGNTRHNPPSATSLWTGKMVGEDSATDREAETVGFVVFEAGRGNVNGVVLEAGITDLIVEGLGNKPAAAHWFSEPFEIFPPKVALVAPAGMKGNQGGWPVTYPAPLTSKQQLGLSFDEDIMNDAERNHRTEEIAYVAFEAPTNGGSSFDGGEPPNQSMLREMLCDQFNTSECSAAWQGLCHDAVDTLIFHGAECVNSLLASAGQCMAISNPLDIVTMVGCIVFQYPQSGACVGSAINDFEIEVKKLSCSHCGVGCPAYTQLGVDIDGCVNVQQTVNVHWRCFFPTWTSPTRTKLVTVAPNIDHNANGPIGLGSCPAQGSVRWLNINSNPVCTRQNTAEQELSGQPTLLVRFQCNGTCPATDYRVTLNVSGLPTGGSLTARLNWSNGSSGTVTFGNGQQAFPPVVAAGQPHTVSLQGWPQEYTCTLSNGGTQITGSGGSDVTYSVTCTEDGGGGVSQLFVSTAGDGFDIRDEAANLEVSFGAPVSSTETLQLNAGSTTEYLDTQAPTGTSYVMAVTNPWWVPENYCNEDPGDCPDASLCFAISSGGQVNTAHLGVVHCEAIPTKPIWRGDPGPGTTPEDCTVFCPPLGTSGGDRTVPCSATNPECLCEYANSDGTCDVKDAVQDECGMLCSDVFDTNPGIFASISSPTLGGGLNVTDDALIINATATDSDGVDYFRIGVDGQEVGLIDVAGTTANLVGYVVDTSSLPDGVHRLTVQAMDGPGTMPGPTDMDVDFLVESNPTGGCGSDTTLPWVELTAPTNAPAPFTQVILKANAGDSNGIDRVVFKVDGVTYGVDTNAPYQAASQWQAVPGTHTVYATAVDECGNLQTDQATFVVGDPCAGQPLAYFSDLWVQPYPTGPMYRDGDFLEPTNVRVYAELVDPAEVGVGGVGFEVEGYNAWIDLNGAPWVSDIYLFNDQGPEAVVVTATDGCGRSITETITVQVTQDAEVCAVDFVPPWAGIHQPPEGFPIPAGSTVTLAAHAADSGGLRSATPILDGIERHDMTVFSGNMDDYVWVFPDVPAATYVVEILVEDVCFQTNVSLPRVVEVVP
jgi:hypothetical protein